MKITMLSGKLSGGGAERVSCVLANEFSLNADVDILRGDSSESETFPLNTSVKVINLSFNYIYKL